MSRGPGNTKDVGLVQEYAAVGALPPFPSRASRDAWAACVQSSSLLANNERAALLAHVGATPYLAAEDETDG